MKIITDQKYIDRNVKITKYITWASLGVLGMGIYLTITQKESTQTLYHYFCSPADRIYTFTNKHLYAEQVGKISPAG